MAEPVLESDYRYAEDIDGIWHIRRDDFWDNDITADVRAHAQCGADIWSCRVSSFHPSESYVTLTVSELCSACFDTKTC